MRRIYIHQDPEWPQFNWDHEALMPTLAEVRNQQGRLIGKMEALGFSLREEASLATLTQDVLKSTEIEGENLNTDQVRSSIARRLGIDISGLVPSDRNVEGVVAMVLDATQHYKHPLSRERLFSWHVSLFPSDYNTHYKIVVGNWREDSTGPMQVVSGALGKEKVHFEAPASELLEKEMIAFLKWLNAKDKDKLDPVLKAGIAHLWFVTIHPFDDGNGRIARAIADMLLARADANSQRFYSMSAQIRKERKTYYDMLEHTQKGSLDITAWLHWFLSCLGSAVSAAESSLDSVLSKARFWEKHAATPLNERQRKMIAKLQDGFTGKLSSSKWATIAKCSADTALRDIQDLIGKEVLSKEPGGGRSTNYELRKF